MDEQYQYSKDYASKGKITISSVVILFVACFIIFFFQVYIRYWFRRRLLQNRRRHHLNASSAAIISHGLDSCALNSLPTFVYESKNQESPLECAVCLSEFEDSEAGRILPECNHCFHVDCIDMWLQSHCHCPLCRARVRDQPVKKPGQPIENPDNVVLSINASDDMDSGSGTRLNPTCQSDGINRGCSSSSSTSSSSSRTPDDPLQLTGPMKNEGAPDPGGDIGSDIESKTPANSVRVLKRLISI